MKNVRKESGLLVNIAMILPIFGMSAVKAEGDTMIVDESTMPLILMSPDARCYRDNGWDVAEQGCTFRRCLL